MEVETKWCIMVYISACTKTVLLQATKSITPTALMASFHETCAWMAAQFQPNTKKTTTTYNFQDLRGISTIRNVYIYILYTCCVFFFDQNQSTFIFFEKCWLSMFGASGLSPNPHPKPPWNTLTLPASTKLLALRRDSMPMSPHSWSMGCGHSSNSPAFN